MVNREEGGGTRERSGHRARGKRARPMGSETCARCGRAGTDKGRARARPGSGEHRCVPGWVG